MSKTSIDTPIKALYCYCLLAIGVTLIVAQDRVWSQEKTDSKSTPAAKVASDKQASDKVAHEKQADEIKTERDKDKNESSKDSASSSQSSESKSGAKGLAAGKQNLPVVQIKTSATEGSDSHLVFQSGAFDVVPPEWYEEPVQSADDKLVIKFFAHGFSDELLKDDFDTRLQSKIDSYVDQLLGPAANRFVRFTDSEKEQLITRKEVRPGIYFDGQKRNPIDFCFTEVVFDKPFDQLVTNKWVEKRQQSRLIQYGLIAGASLLLIGFVFGGLRLNSATSGFYQGRLQFFVAIVILGVIAAGFYFGTKIDWL